MLKPRMRVEVRSSPWGKSLGLLDCFPRFAGGRLSSVVVSPAPKFALLPLLLGGCLSEEFVPVSAAPVGFRGRLLPCWFALGTPLFPLGPADEVLTSFEDAGVALCLLGCL